MRDMHHARSLILDCSLAYFNVRAQSKWITQKKKACMQPSEVLTNREW